MYDWYNRYSFLDHFLGEETTFEQFRRCQYPELGNFINQPYELVDIKENRKTRLACGSPAPARRSLETGGENRH